MFYKIKNLGSKSASRTKPITNLALIQLRLNQFRLAFQVLKNFDANRLGSPFTLDQHRLACPHRNQVDLLGTSPPTTNPGWNKRQDPT